jgi:hypothetical protein
MKMKMIYNATYGVVVLNSDLYKGAIINILIIILIYMSLKVVQTIAIFCVSTIAFFIILECFSSWLMPISIAFSVSVLIGLLVAPAYYKDLFKQ